MSKHKWTLEEADRLKKFVDGKRCFIVLLHEQQVGLIDVPPEQYNDEFGVQFHYGSESNQDWYDLGNGIDISDYKPSDFVVKKLVQLDWLTCDFELQVDSSLREIVS